MAPSCRRHAYLIVCAVVGGALHDGREQRRQQVARRARRGSPWAGRSCPRGRRRAARSSASRAAWRGSPCAPAPPRPPCAPPGSRSARCRGGLPRRGAVKVSWPGRGAVGRRLGQADRRRGRVSETSRPLSQPLPATRNAQPSGEAARRRPAAPRPRGPREQRVEPVHDPAVAREDRAHVLDPEVALDGRLGEVADGRRDGDGEPRAASPLHQGAVEGERMARRRRRRCRRRPSRRSPPRTSSG